MAQSYIGADIVKVKLAAGGTLDVDSATESNLLVAIGFAVLEVGEFLFEVADIVVDVELFFVG